MNNSNIDLQELAEDQRRAIHYLELAQELTSLNLAAPITELILQVERYARELESEAGCVYNGEGRVV